jgi:hypothetical protein
LYDALHWPRGRRRPATQRPRRDIYAKAMELWPTCRPRRPRRALAREGATPVNSVARIILFGAAAVVGIVSVVYFPGRPTGEMIIPFGNPHMQDGFMWVIGIWLLAYCLYRLVWGAADLDWRWPIYLILGSTMVYMQWFNVAPMKEAACQILHARHHPVPVPCYKGADPGNG